MDARPRRAPGHRARRGDRLQRVGRLDDVDLSLRLTRKQEESQLAEQEDRLAAAAPRPRRPDGRRHHRARRCASSSRAGTPPARAAPSSASSTSSTRGTCGSSQFAAPTYDEKRHHFLWRFWPRAARLGRHGRLRPLLVRPGAGRAGRGLRHRGAVAAGLRRDRGLRGDARRRGHDPGEVLDARLPRGAAAPLRSARRTTR